MTIILTLTEEEVNTVLQGLGELPGKIMLPVYNKIQMQGSQQIREAEMKKQQPLEVMDKPYTDEE